MKYSVLMPIYYKENANNLEISVDSMLNQTIRPNEFVIVEDGKLTEELYDVIDKYKKNKIFKIIKLPTNRGLRYSLSIGVKECSNEFIARMDSDDYAVSDRCEKELNEMIKKNLDIVGSNVGEFVNNIDNIVSYRIVPSSNKEIYKYSKKRDPFSHPSIMFRKSKVIEANYYYSEYLFEDYDLWIRMLRNNARCYNIQEVLVLMRVNDNFYKRRGGIKYLKSMLMFRKHLYDIKYTTLCDYLSSSLAHILVCLIPNKLRKIIYLKLLRIEHKKAS